MAKEIIRTLGQLRTTVGDDLVLYSVPEGHSAVISSILLTNTDLSVADVVTVHVRRRGQTSAQGVNTSISANKLIDSNAKFLATVNINDNVQVWDGGFTTVNSVDSDTQLTLASDIFTTSGGGDDYVVWPPSPSLSVAEAIKWQESLAAKDTISIKEGITLSEFGQIFITTDNGTTSCVCFGVEKTASNA